TRFDQQADAAGLGTPSPTGLSAYQTVIAASLIQTEAGVDEDRPLIAAVIINRLRDGTMLQIDSTLCFIKGGCTGSLTNADKQLASPYNTYLVKGLPPTPISTVSTASLKAALAPANVPYRFYVIADRSGKHAFAVTYEEHLKNVATARAKGLL
ncbi:MAG TPA: endolytic transglycosylase MltG, partial [Acidimicrobiia bacterium]